MVASVARLHRFELWINAKFYKSESAVDDRLQESFVGENGGECREAAQIGTVDQRQIL